MSKKYNGYISAILPVTQPDGGNAFITYTLHGCVCRKKILRHMRRYLKLTYGTSLRKLYFDKRVCIEDNTTDYSSEYRAFQEFVNRVVAEEEERRALESKGVTNSEGENVSSSDVSMRPMPDQLDGSTQQGCVS